MRRTDEGGKVPYVKYNFLLECVFGLCRRYYQSHYRADMIYWLKVLKHETKRTVHCVNPSLNCLDTDRKYLKYLSQSYEEGIHAGVDSDNEHDSCSNRGTLDNWAQTCIFPIDLHYAVVLTTLQSQ